ncbi:hypothetical protein BH11PSE12_BH11PSE12_22110 [soil metagenome]
MLLPTKIPSSNASAWATLPAGFSRVLATGWLSVLALSGCDLRINQHELKGSGKFASEMRTVGPFDAISNTTSFDLEVNAEGSATVEITGDDNLLAEVETVVEGSTLVIRNKNPGGIRSSWTRSPLTVKIHAPQISHISNTGSGDISVRQLHGALVEINSNSSGDIQASGKVNELRLQSTGSGDIHIDQLPLERLQLALKGSGSFRLGDTNTGPVVPMKTVQAELYGSGDLVIEHLTAEQASITLDSSSAVRLSGEVKQLTLNIRGSGDIDSSQLQVEHAEIKNAGSSNVSLKSISGNLKAEMAGSGDLDADLRQAGQIELNLSGSGNVTLAGSAKRLTAMLKGSGDLHATALVLDSASVKVTGSGEAEVNVKAAADAGQASSTRTRRVRIDRNGVM